jgi:hypothetical protein
MRRSLYLKDDDYRLSFLYGNFTTLTRFTEADLERVVTERSRRCTCRSTPPTPTCATDMLRNRRGATSLRWLRALLDHGIEVHGQIVVCPGVNDGACSTTRWPACSTGSPTSPVGRRGAARHLEPFNQEPAMRLHTPAEANRVVDLVEQWQACSSTCSATAWCSPPTSTTSDRRPFPPAEAYEGFPMHEDGIGMARTFELEFEGRPSRRPACGAGSSRRSTCPPTRPPTPGCASTAGSSRCPPSSSP